jgi:hypothetical protein
MVIEKQLQILKKYRTRRPADLDDMPIIKDLVDLELMQYGGAWGDKRVGDVTFGSYQVTEDGEFVILANETKFEVWKKDMKKWLDSKIEFIHILITRIKKTFIKRGKR